MTGFPLVAGEGFGPPFFLWKNMRNYRAGWIMIKLIYHFLLFIMSAASF